MVTICAGQDVSYRLVDVFAIRPGELIVDRWLASRGPGTLGIAVTHTVTDPARRHGHPPVRWALRCRSEVYLGRVPHVLPVMNDH